MRSYLYNGKRTKTSENISDASTNECTPKKKGLGDSLLVAHVAQQANHLRQPCPCCFKLKHMGKSSSATEST
jgi:hypothetical protein